MCSILANFGVAGLGDQILIIAMIVGDSKHWFLDLFGRVGFDCYDHKSVLSFFIMISDSLMPDLLNLRESALAVYEYDHNHNFSVYS